ncbi:MAG TPA: pitrilysin family protein [Gemmatimonadaceae bacterium]|nr:pitrilysin family protein [Gemmatimonadaceae bacterium]
MTPHTLRAAVVRGALGVAFVAAAGAAQQPLESSFDRTVIPPAGPAPELHIPQWTTTTLANGATLVVSERHELPLVSFAISFVGGADQYDPADKPGVGTFTAGTLLEGTTHRTGDQISNALQLLGSQLFTPSVAGESGRLQFESTTSKFVPTLDILADVVEHATFPAAAIERYRARQLVSLTQARDRTSSIAAQVFPKVVYTTAHPYGRTMTEASAKAITRDDITSFYKEYYRPSHAVITVVGDVTPAQVKQQVEHALADWSGSSPAPSFDYPTVRPPAATTIYLVDKPGAAQSTFTIGAPGPSYATPDYYATTVMNELLGGLFQSRLNHDIREVKGYSYGVGSAFAFGRGPGAFRAGGDIVTAKTDSALVEFMKQLRDIRGPVPPSADELSQAKASLVQSLPERFSSDNGVNASIAQIYTMGLPQDWYQRLIKGVNAVTSDDVVRAAQQHIDPAHLAIVIVGDRSKVEEPLAATKIAPITLLDIDGNPIAARIQP